MGPTSSYFLISDTILFCPSSVDIYFPYLILLGVVYMFGASLCFMSFAFS